MARPRSAAVTKLLVLVVENHSLRQMKAGMPWTFGLAHRYGYAKRYHAITHPSLPNYLAIAGGSTFGVRDDNNPVAHQLSGRSVFGQAVARGKSAKTYAEGMPSPCSLTNNSAGRYAVRHNPWTYFVDERGSCRKHDVPFTALAADVKKGALPNAGFVVPDLCHDAHDCSLAVADDWMRSTIRTVMDGPDWASGHLAVVVTADEDDRHSGNRVLTVVVHPSQRGNVVRHRLTHYSLTRLYDQVIGAKPLRKAKKAPSMAKAFDLPLPRS
ncbi:alkaline phosphatase family protein [Nocardioides sp. MAHUQ-72]|uniref:alkaline phosphatase family protein n=1 Tax=unclassified Nocardioides TaxID=2615069 RepID=UPI00360DC822